MLFKKMSAGTWRFALNAKFGCNETNKPVSAESQAETQATVLPGHRKKKTPGYQSHCRVPGDEIRAE